PRARHELGHGRGGSLPGRLNRRPGKTHDRTDTAAMPDGHKASIALEELGCRTRCFPEKIQPAIDRCQGERMRLLRVLDAPLKENEFLAGDYSTANWAWARTHRWSCLDIAARSAPTWRAGSRNPTSA
ncbi:MAG: hypothetical protein M3Y67_11405, partial [Pseudomonadota bacterium]|nr:hypothetical protein [Pseudomonadota bacterium]